ncbi:MAG: hypothetical protein E7538_01745 [Ruminococcaceae bacterium]|nr:hypothetical protein [Oscillospiraceae bacterium]
MIFFKKKNKTIEEKGDVSQLVSSKTEVEKDKSVSPPRKSAMYKFKPIYSNYESIEEVVNIIEEIEITLERIHTWGTSSSHDGDIGFDNSYNNMAEFKSKVFEDYKRAKERYKDCANLNWGCTIFSFYKSFRDKGMQISIISIGPEAEEINFLIDYTDEDEFKVESVIVKVEEYLEEY